jgi:hypothetical protein
MVVLDKSTYKEISSLLVSGFYEIPRKNLTSQVEKIPKLLTKYKNVLPAAHLTSMDLQRYTNLAFPLGQ